VLRTAVSASGLYDPLAEDNSPDANRQKALTLTARIPTLIAAWVRLRQGQEPLPPQADLRIAENFLYMATGQDPDPTAVEAVDRYLILLADHEMNASTFAARAVTSTTSDMYSAITAAIGSLKGPSHGGAIEASMRMFLEIQESGLSVEEWFQQVRAGSRRIMGIGHRIYKTEDPRARILREYTRSLAEKTGHSRIYEIAYQLEMIARADTYFIERNLYPNVDYYSGLMLYVVGIPVEVLTTMFAMSRIVGWTAHVMEQWKDNRLMRPKAQYVGETGLTWTPVENR
jgi:citrate synthase